MPQVHAYRAPRNVGLKVVMWLVCKRSMVFPPACECWVAFLFPCGRRHHLFLEQLQREVSKHRVARPRRGWLHLKAKQVLKEVPKRKRSLTAQWCVMSIVKRSSKDIRNYGAAEHWLVQSILKSFGCSGLPSSILKNSKDIWTFCMHWTWETFVCQWAVLRICIICFYCCSIKDCSLHMNCAGPAPTVKLAEHWATCPSS